MLRSCKYCMRVHDTKIDCGRKPPPRYYKRENDKDKFRQSMPWRHKREEIRIRDKQLCQVCIRNLYDTLDQYTYNDISVIARARTTEPRRFRCWALAAIS